MRYTNDPPNLIPPTEATIEWLAKREGVGTLTKLESDFVWDLLAKTSGAQVAEFNEAEAIEEAEFHAIVETDAYMERHPEADANKVSHKFKHDYHHLQHQFHAVLEHLDLNEIPGYNHAAKAIRAIKLLRRLEVLWVQVVHMFAMANQMATMIQQAINTVQSLSDDDKAALERLVGPGSGNKSEDAELLGIELELSQLDLGEVIRIARHLDTLSELQRSRSKLTADPNGEDVKLRGIRDLSELGKVGQQEFALPRRLRMQRAVEGQPYVREPHTRRDKKQLLFMVVDGTGSMMHYEAVSASRAAGVVMNRLQAVIDGDAEVYMHFFDVDMRAKEYHAHDAASAREIMSIVTNSMHYQGAGTVFDATLKSASSRVRTLLQSGKLKEPELVFVTDGDADIPDLSVLDGIKMHAVQVGVSEDLGLSKLARASGGIGIHVALAASL